jgi:transcriptional regulator with XRE-family HTH domain
MFYANRLLAKMTEKGISKTDIASALGVDSATLYRKLNGDSEFKRSEIEILRNRLNLTVNEAEAIFFAD